MKVRSANRSLVILRPGLGKKRPWPVLPQVLLMVEFTAVNSVAVTSLSCPQTAGFAVDQVLIKEPSLCSVPATRMLIPQLSLKTCSALQPP